MGWVYWMERWEWESQWRLRRKRRRSKKEADEKWRSVWRKKKWMRRESKGSRRDCKEVMRRVASKYQRRWKGKKVDGQQSHKVNELWSTGFSVAFCTFSSFNNTQECLQAFILLYVSCKLLLLASTFYFFADEGFKLLLFSWVWHTCSLWSFLD